MTQAQLMQYLGNMGQSWVFTSYAARLIISMNYHEIKSADLPLAHEEEIKGCIFCCYYLDRTLGSLFHRPLSLPEPRLSVTELASVFSNDLHATLMPVVLDLARVQGELLKCCKLADRGAKLAHQSNLNDQMVEIFPRLHCVSYHILVLCDIKGMLIHLKPTRTYGSDVFSCEWLAVEFAYHAIMVDIMRSRLKFMFSPMTHRECIAHSRTALKAMLSIQKILANTPGYEDPFPSFLTW
ncbi:transcriptional regulator family: Fungal Specific TF [Penicillium chermesinum]|uniref:Transcriptional regulator family: Fungal Specific TF n=1 Tax=Penicillium chermesinum TaxID=63820 RepID=A0A9W9PGZ4_9EURO|nr:transcriptional regulator family: Fungal Specific TF [Penicillium chermesinum]KAJ5246540.1 transcriptional regulator family: Fungal Specific TF [Penicillium chermesinum]